MRSFSLRYTLLTYKLDQLWFPAGLWALFVILAIIFRSDGSKLFDVARAYLGAVLPLLGGVLAAYVVLDDPVLELRFATPVPAWQVLSERLGFTLSILALTAFSYQALVVALGCDLAQLGNPLAVQLAWLVPTLAMMGLGCLGALVFAQPTAGAMLVGLVWLFELVARGWFIDDRWARYFMLFLGIFVPGHPDLRLSQLVLLAVTIVFLIVAWALYHKQERYI